MNVLIVTDSRGRGLDQRIQGVPRLNACHIKTAFLPGASLERLAIETIQEAGRSEYDWLIVFGGICSFTEKVNYRGEKRLHYPIEKSEEKKTKAIETIEDLYRRFPNKANVCTIPPASPTKYFTTNNPGKSTPEGLEEEGKKLIEDLETVNNKIRELDIEKDQETINTSARVFKHSLKRYKKQTTYRRVTRFSDKELPDGVHFNVELGETIHYIIIENIYKKIQDNQ